VSFRGLPTTDFFRGISMAMSAESPVETLPESPLEEALRVTVYSANF